MKSSWALLLVIISTTSYYAPSMVFSYDASGVPEQFYRFYCLFVASQLFLITVYSLYLFASTPISNLKTKLIFLWLLIAESTTFADHVIRKYIVETGFVQAQFWITLGVFTICCAFVVLRAYRRTDSEPFDPRKTYILSFLPDNLYGLINYLYDRSGHKGVYIPDGFVYKFRKDTGQVEKRKAYIRMLKDKKIAFKEISSIKNPDRLIGKRFNLFFYNCNHFVSDAQRTT